MTRSFVAVEWGTARYVARLIADGTMIDRVEEPVAFAGLDRAAIGAALDFLRKRWGTATGPIRMAGMGVTVMCDPVPTPVAAPATLELFAAEGATTADDSLRISPGVRCTNAFGDPDQMRGEEIALFALADRTRLVVSVPGMHAKWVELAPGRIECFHTAMTAELASLLSRNGMLASLMTVGPHPGAGFRDGVARGLEGGAAARLLFSARSRALGGLLDRQEVSSYVWGVLIGNEIADAIARYRPRSVDIVGSAHNMALYAAAFEHAGIATTQHDADALAATGFSMLQKCDVVDAV